MVTDLDGHITQNVVYIPYGEVFVEERNGSWTSSYLFNAKELDEETGLYYYGARYLNPSIALWLSTDPLQGKYPGMSPYNYCAGNPVKLVDPDGRSSFIWDSSEEGGWIMYDYEHDKFYKELSVGNISKDEYTPPQGSFLYSVRNDYRKLGETTTGQQMIEYFSDAKNEVRIIQSQNRSGCVKEEPHHVLFNEKGGDIIPTTSGTDGSNSPTWVILGYELAHKIDYDKRGKNVCNKEWFTFGWGSISEKIVESEKYATHIENKLRSEAGLPLRTHYIADAEYSAILQSVNYKESTFYLRVSRFKFDVEGMSPCKSQSYFMYK